MTKLRILGRFTSINVRKVVWTCDELGIAYDREDWGLPVRDPNVPEFLRLNPNAQVPVIVDDGFVLWESSAVLRYLARQASEATSGPPTMPSERAHRRPVAELAGERTRPELEPTRTRALLRGNPPNPEPARIAASSRCRWTAGRCASSMHIWRLQQRLCRKWPLQPRGHCARTVGAPMDERRVRQAGAAGGRSVSMKR